MHKIMKKYIIIFIGFLVLVSCSDFLVESPKTQISSDQFFDSPDDARSSVNGLYRVGVGSWHGFSTSYWDGTDAMRSGYLSGLFEHPESRIGVQVVKDLQMNAVNLSEWLNSVWSGHYNAIARANLAIANIPDVPGLSETEMNRLLAEARFFRAFNYFNLVKNFGDIPLVLEPVVSLGEIFVSRDNAANVYQQIITDLNWAIDNGGLSGSPFPMNNYRVTRGLAETILAEAYLQMAGYPVQDASGYANAADAARSVIQSGEYELIEHGPTLEQSAYNVVRTSKVEREYIYAIEYDASITTNPYPSLAYPRHARPPGTRYPDGYNAYIPMQELINIYDPDLDLRVQHQQLFHSWMEVGGSVVEFGEYAPWLWRDEVAIFETGRGNMNHNVYRYPLVLLIAAEAIARSEGVTSEAVNYLADVRDRAYWQTDRSDIVAELSGLPVQEFVEEVWKERIRELALEFKIWGDIQRTRQYPVALETNPGEVEFVDVIGQTNNRGVTFQERHLLLPLSNDEMQRNPNLTQNPGY
jgi:starch-binding outer membrane protein, SusD/RagB family